MLLSLCFGASVPLIVIAWSGATDFDVNGNHNVQNSGKCCRGATDSDVNGNNYVQNSGMLVPVRRTRSLGWLGIRALRKLIDGARKVPTITWNYKKYVKTGGTKQAEKDFEDLNAKNVIQHTLLNGMHIKQGEVGDRIFMYTGRGGKSKPTIDVIKSKKLGGDADNSFHRIIYDD